MPRSLREKLNDELRHNNYLTSLRQAIGITVSGIGSTMSKNICKYSCLHYSISPSLYQKSWNDAYVLEERRKLSPKYHARSVEMYDDLPKYQLIGSLAHNGTLEFLNNNGFYIERSEYSDEKEKGKGDEWDFKYKSLSFDIKAMGLNNPKFKFVHRKSEVRVFIWQGQKVVGHYVFVFVDVENKMLHIVGICEYDRFWTLSEEKLKGSANLSVEILHPLFGFLNSLDEMGAQNYNRRKGIERIH